MKYRYQNKYQHHKVAFFVARVLVSDNVFRMIAYWSIEVVIATKVSSRPAFPIVIRMYQSKYLQYTSYT